jgi:hypothetical protein
MRTEKCVLALLLLLPFGAVAQHDLQYRGALSVRQDLPKGFTLTLGYQIRIDHNMSAFQASYLTADLSYKAHKYLDVEGELRYGTSRQWDNFRYSIGVASEKKLLKKLTVSGKLRYQYQHSLQAWGEIGQYPDRHQIRLKVGLGFKLHKKVEADLSTEPMFAITEMTGNFRRIRTQLTFGFNLPKGFTLEVGAFHQPRLDEPSSDVTWALLTGLRYDLPKAWWKKKEKKS